MRPQKPKLSYKTFLSNLKKVSRKLRPIERKYSEKDLALTFVTSAMSISLIQLMLNRQNETNSLNPEVFVSIAVPDRYTLYLLLSSCVDLQIPNCVRICYDTGQR